MDFLPVDMKGKLELRKYNEWIVTFDGDYLHLHPDDVNWIIEQEKMFDNMIGRIKASPEVEFKIVEHQKLTGVVKYAKLKK